MDYEQLKTFLTVADVKSFTKAAELLHITQSTVTSRIQAVENFYGKQLLTRSKRGIKLAEIGTELLPYLQRQMELWNKSLRMVSEHHAALRTITIAATYSLWRGTMVQIIRDLQSSSFSLRLETDHSPIIVEKVLDGTIDAGFVYNKPVSPNIVSIHVLNDTYRLYGHKHFAGTDLENILELPRLPWIYMNWGHHFEKWLKEEIGSDLFKPLIEVGHSELEMKLIEEMEGVGFLPDEMVERTRTDLVPLTVGSQKPIPAQNVYFIYKKSRGQEEAIQTVVEKLRNNGKLNI